MPSVVCNKLYEELKSILDHLDSLDDISVKKITAALVKVQEVKAILGFVEWDRRRHGDRRHDA